MAALATQKVTRNGAAVTYTAAAGGGDTCKPGANTVLHVKNGGGASITVTVTSTGSVYGHPIVLTPVAIGAGLERLIGPLRPEVVGNAAGDVAIAYTAVTTVTVAVIDVSD